MSSSDLSYQCSVVSGDQEFFALSDQWSSLAAADTAATPFNTHCWLSLWWKHYQQHKDALHIVQFVLDDELIAIAPLYTCTTVQLKLVKQRELRWLGQGGDTSPDYLNLICLPEHRAAIEKKFAHYVAQYGEVERINLADIVNPSSLFEELNNALAEQSGSLNSTITNVLLRADLPETWEEYRMALSRKRRKQINHRRNRLDEAGDWSLMVCETDQQRAIAVAALEDLHRERWISKGEAGGFASDAYIEFHRDVIEAFAKQDQLWMVTLTLNNEIIGVLYLFLWRNTLLFFQSGFSPEQERLSPGHVMFTYVMGEAIERGIKKIDLLKGDYQYKSVYAKDACHTSNLILIRPGLGNVLSQTKQTIRSLGKKGDGKN